MTAATTTAPAPSTPHFLAATSGKTPADRINILGGALGPDFTPQVIRSESDAHGEACGWCHDGAPCVTNIYFTETHGGVVYDEMAHTCEAPACILAATDQRDDQVAVVEVSLAPLAA